MRYPPVEDNTVYLELMRWVTSQGPYAVILGFIIFTAYKTAWPYYKATVEEKRELDKENQKLVRESIEERRRERLADEQKSKELRSEISSMSQVLQSTISNNTKAMVFQAKTNLRMRQELKQLSINLERSTD